MTIDDKYCHTCGKKMTYREDLMYRNVMYSGWLCENCGEKVFSSYEAKKIEMGMTREEYKESKDGGNNN